MSLSDLSIDSSSPWGQETPQTADFVRDAMHKEALIKEILASQEDLRTLLSRVQTVQKEVDKLTSGNETLQMYIDNLTVQMAKRR
ncbi:hypothetical protein AX17_005021 [Amanita inopinata Kibby_2008]|nr:hypothetical protein AX17_005021 [Amanita inopinata Kibby_2008]